jgi:uncharacterized protein DUF4145
MDTIHVRAWIPQDPEVISLRCPGCRQQGTLEAAPTHDLLTEGNGNGILVGNRRCPNPQCNAHLFIVYHHGNSGVELLASYPPETIDFVTANLPKAVLQSLDEAIRCHAAQCYRAAALMVRRTLEDLCADRGADGNNLKVRLEALSGKVAVAHALVEGLDSLRLLGNDAAHVELHDFDEIGKTEAELAIEITKEMLKGVYQYEDLVARLEALKRPPEA